VRPTEIQAQLDAWGAIDAYAEAYSRRDSGGQVAATEAINAALVKVREVERRDAGPSTAFIVTMAISGLSLFISGMSVGMNMMAMRLAGHN
jgi:hypothetical protein